MSNRWIAQVLLVTPAAHRATAAGLVAHVTGNPHDAAPESFSIAAIDGGEVTHWAALTRIREQTLAALPELAQAIPGALWCVTSHDEDSPEQAAERLGLIDYLTTQGLRLHTPDEDTP